MRIYSDPYLQLERLITKLEPRIVGISSYTSEIDNAKTVSKMVKTINRNIIVIIGGYHASAMPEQLLKESPYIDLLVHGEGELTLTEIYRKLESGDNFSDVDGIAYRHKDLVIVNRRRKLIANLDKLSFTPREKLELDKYIPNPGTGNYMHLPTTGIIASRGCPYRCNYCSKGVWGNSIRFRSIENVLSEINLCMDRFGIHDFRFYDDGLTLPQWDLEEFCEQIIKRELNISWNCYSRVNHINKEKLMLMKEAGCYHIKYGIEFGTEKAIKLANKGATLQQAKKAVQLTKEVGIECKGNFMLGIPGETVEDCKKTISFAIELSPDLVTFYPVGIFPGSHYFKRKLEGDRTIEKRLPSVVTQKLSNRAYIAFYFRIGYVLQRLKRLIKNPEREIRLVKNGLIMMVKYIFLNRN